MNFNRRNVSRRVSFPIRAGHKTAYIYIEQIMYRYIEDLTTPKRWFEDNINQILSLYAEEHRLQKEDVFLGEFHLHVPYGFILTTLLSYWHA